MSNENPKNFKRIHVCEVIEQDLKDNPEMTPFYDVAETQYQLASFLRNERRREGLTQHELAKRTGMPQPSISRLEKLGHSPKVESLIAYLHALDIDLVDALTSYRKHQLLSREVKEDLERAYKEAQLITRKEK